MLNVHGYKIVITTVILFFCSTNVNAQKNLVKHDSKRIHFGIAMSVLRSQFSIDRSSSFVNNDTIISVTSPVSAGFGLAIVSNFKINDHLDIRIIPGISLYEKQLDYDRIELDEAVVADEKIESIILSTPISLKFKSDRFFDNFRFYVLSGARFDYDMASNAKKQRADDIIKLKAFDIAGEVGFGFEIYFPMFIFKPEVKFSQGILNVLAPTQRFNTSEVLNSLRSRMITFSIQFEG